jgi:hypothetical protein
MTTNQVDLDEDDIHWLRDIAETLGRSEEDVIRAAVRHYIGASRRPRRFAMMSAGSGPGGSIADIPEEERLKGFGA